MEGSLSLLRESNAPKGEGGARTTRAVPAKSPTTSAKTYERGVTAPGTLSTPDQSRGIGSWR